MELPMYQNGWYVSDKLTYMLDLIACELNKVLGTDS